MTRIERLERLLTSLETYQSELDNMHHTYMKKLQEVHDKTMKKAEESVARLREQ